MEARTVTGPAKNLMAFAVQARSLSGAPGVQLTVATFERPSAPTGAFCDALQARDIPFERIREKHTGDPGVVSQLRALVESHQPDILQTHNSKSHFLARSMRLDRRVPWIAFHHGFTARDWRDRLYNRLSRWALRAAPQVVTVCGAFARDLEAWGVPAARISIRHNSITPWPPPPPPQLAALKESLGIPAASRVVLAVGRLSWEKAHRDLVAAAARLHAARPALDFRLVLVGEGPEQRAVQQLARELGAGSLLVMAGQQADVRPFYGIADVFALPSHSEGSPNVLLEAMAAGLPIVATAVGGSVELASDGETALLVNPGDPPALADALDRVLSDRALAARLAGSAQTASRLHTPEAYARWMVAFYQQVLANREMQHASRIGNRSAL